MEAKPLKDSTATFEPKPGARRAGRSLQPLPIRVAHWLNVPLLVLMAGSGLQILTAYPSLGPQGSTVPMVSVPGNTTAVLAANRRMVRRGASLAFRNRVVLRPQRVHLPHLFSGEWRVAPPPVSTQAGHLERD